jgi:hypothetical protein
MSFGKAILCCQIWRGFRWGSHPISGSGELSTYGSAVLHGTRYLLHRVRVTQLNGTSKNKSSSYTINRPALDAGDKEICDQIDQLVVS